jgi:APA family basic amino acid/polyamine antiporter
MHENHNSVGAGLTHQGSLLRILGVGFGLAIVVGGTVGVGILRSPGPIAEHLGSVWLIVLVWILGGLYALFGANYLAELATMMPKAGGYFVYAHRAYGSYGGFVVGWSDWLYNTLALSFIAVVFGEYTVALFDLQFPGARILTSVLVLASLATVNWIGLRSGSTTQKLTSILKCAALIGFVAACFIYGKQDVPLDTVPAVAIGGLAGLVSLVLAFQLVMSTYDGWQSAIYFTEEDTNPKRNLPRSMFGGILIVITIYLLVNIAILYVLPVSQLAGSKFAGGDAVNVIFGPRGGQIVTILALLSLIGILNAILMMAPRMLLALGREGLFTSRATEVNRGGSPVFALAITAIFSVAASIVGTFEILLAVSQFFAVVITILCILALFVLRRREPELPRPFRAWAYPIAPLVMLVFAVLLFFAYIYSNPYPSAYALGVLAVSYPIFRLVRRKTLP